MRVFTIKILFKPEVQRIINSLSFSNFIMVRIMANIKQKGINLVRTFDSVKIEYMKYVRKPCPSSTTRSRKFTA